MASMLTMKTPTASENMGSTSKMMQAPSMMMQMCQMHMDKKHCMVRGCSVSVHVSVMPGLTHMSRILMTHRLSGRTPHLTTERNSDQQHSKAGCSPGPPATCGVSGPAVLSAAPLAMLLHLCCRGRSRQHRAGSQRSGSEPVIAEWLHHYSCTGKSCCHLHTS